MSMCCQHVEITVPSSRFAKGTSPRRIREILSNIAPPSYQACVLSVATGYADDIGKQGFHAEWHLRLSPQLLLLLLLRTPVPFTIATLEIPTSPLVLPLLLNFNPISALFLRRSGGNGATRSTVWHGDSGGTAAAATADGSWRRMDVAKRAPLTPLLGQQQLRKWCCCLSTWATAPRAP